MVVPGAGFIKFRQFLRFSSSVVVLYLCAMVFRSSFTTTMMGIHPPGTGHEVGWAMGERRVEPRGVTRSGTSAEGTVGISCVGIGDANSTANVGGMGEGVGGWEDLVDSVNASETPPMTSSKEIAPIMTPLPIWRRTFTVNSPSQACLQQWEAGR
jgi:hypothetical protein